jgi:hypothetical protein
MAAYQGTLVGCRTIPATLNGHDRPDWGRRSQRIECGFSPPQHFAHPPEALLQKMEVKVVLGAVYPWLECFLTPDHLIGYPITEILLGPKVEVSIPVVHHKFKLLSKCHVITMGL